MAEEFRLKETDAPAKLSVAALQPGIIYFSDRRSEGAGDGTGLVHFEDWVRKRPQESRILSLYPGYREPVVKVTAHGVTKTIQRKLQMFVAEARFMISRPAGSIDFKRYAKQDFFEKIDPAVKSRRIEQGDAIPLKDPDYAYNAHPDRRWCERDPGISCIESRYQLEGKLPMGIRLANKLSDSGKKIPEFIEFQSELRALTPEQAGQYAGLAALTGLDSPVVGALEQNIFYVNQILQFGKILAVFQPHPTDPGKTVVTAFIALAIKTDVLEKRKEFGAVPVLRNLVPSQVLMGNSSFNTGTSISAGLPAYTRNRAKAIASILERG
jgi:hypothetical protein